MPNFAARAVEFAWAFSADEVELPYRLPPSSEANVVIHIARQQNAVPKTSAKNLLFGMAEPLAVSHRYTADGRIVAPELVDGCQ